MRAKTGRRTVLVVSLLIMMTVAGTWPPHFGVLADASLADFDLSWWTVDSGGDLSTDGSGYALLGTIGQPDAGLSSSTGLDYVLVGGFHRPQFNCTGKTMTYLPLVLRNAP
ncbi:MAG: hypothetical protein JXA33_28275 [Anaerolineae bacterium]|nr:hypothetical protein [Anaerolineae bacterium]